MNGCKSKEERKERERNHKRKNRQDPCGSERNLREENIRREIAKARLRENIRRRLGERK